jgi:hypothetical protein
MNTNVYTTPKFQAEKRPAPKGVGPGWWAAAIASAIFFAAAITWMLTHSGA